MEEMSLCFCAGQIELHIMGSPVCRGC